MQVAGLGSMGTLGLSQLGKRILFPFGDLATSTLIIDPGSSNTRIYHPESGLLLSEPSLVARNTLTGEIVAFGKEAKELLGRTSRFIDVLSPLRNGRIADLDAAAAMLKFFLHKALPRRVRNPEMIIAVPSAATPLERRAMIGAASRAHASNVLLVEQCLMAAVGAGLSITTPTGSVIADIGGGTTDIAVVSFGGLVYSRSVPVGGLQMDRAIADYLRLKQHVLIGDSTAEQIKLEMGSAAPLERGLQFGVTGRDVVTGLPCDVTLTDVDIRDILGETLDQIGTEILTALQHVPPELLGDIKMRGIVLTGGISQLRNIEQRFRNMTGLPVSVADNPFENILRGAAKLLRDPKVLGRLSIREEQTLKRAA
jgi:rod shape-determining protein MreB and related proteins